MFTVFTEFHRAMPLPFDREEDDQLTERTHDGEGHKIRPALWVAGLAGGREDGQGSKGRRWNGNISWERESVSVCIKSGSLLSELV